MYYWISGDQAAANNAFAAAYANGPLGQTVNSSGFYYWGTRGMLGVATVSVTLAAGVGAWEFWSGSQLLVESSGIWNSVRGRIGSGGIFQIRPNGGAPIFRLDWHKIPSIGRSVPHLDFNKLGIKHWPWDQIFK